MNFLKGTVFASFSILSFLVAFVTLIWLCKGLSDQQLNGALNSVYDYRQKVEDAGEGKHFKFHHHELPEDWLWCLLYNGWLVLVFTLQHSIMATDLWRQCLSDIGCTAIGRSLYVLMTSLALQYLMKNWQPLPAPPLWWIDTQESPALYMFFLLIHCLMWLLLYGATLTMDFPELMGIKQVYYYLRGWADPLAYKTRKTTMLFRHMRHPGMCCFLIILWCHPIMTPGRFLLASTWSLYLLLGHSVSYEDSVYIDQQVIRKRMTTSDTVHDYYSHID